MSWREEVEAFMERMGYHNVTVDPETNQLDLNFWPPPPYRYFAQRSYDGWGATPAPRLERYRRSSNGTWQEVWLEPDGTTWYGLYMPEGFVPPKELR